MRTGLKIFAGLLVAAGLLLAALPWWLGVVLHPLARAVGAEFSDYQRIGYTRFRIEGAAWLGPGVRVEATGIEADTPLLWLWRHGGMRDAAVAVEGWRVVVTRRESEPSTPATVDGVVALHGLLGRIAAGLERWAPRVTLRNGAVSWPGATLALDGADWQRGTLVLSGVQWAGRRFDGTIGVAPEGTISVAAEEAAGEALTMRLAWSGADVAGEASAWAQTATITTHFAAHGWLPDEATAASRARAATSRAAGSSCGSTKCGISRASRSWTITRPCLTCWGSSLTPGCPRHPMTSTSGIAYTSGSASDSSGLTALPTPEFCR